VTFTATIESVAPGAGAPTGMVVFHDGSTVIGTATVSAGQASITASFAGVGTTHLINASYEGSDDYIASNSANQTLTVLNPTATATLTATPLFVRKKARGATFQIVIQANGVGLPEPTGSATLEIGRRKYKTVVLTNGSASVFVPTAKARGKTFVVDYLGNSTYKPALSRSLHITSKFFKR
jgi:hypothetical protein